MEPFYDSSIQDTGSGGRGKKTSEAFWSLSGQELFSPLGTTPQGLPRDEARRRLEENGANRLKPSRRSRSLSLSNSADRLARHPGSVPHRVVSGIGDLRSVDRACSPNPQTLLGEPAGEIPAFGDPVNCRGHGPLSLHPFGRTLRVSPFASVLLLGNGDDRCLLHDRGGDGQEVLLPEGTILKGVTGSLPAQRRRG